MLRNLEITNFRAFSHLRIERLGRVNLIVGKNNVGKTTLLEALRLYGSVWPRSTVVSILHERNEIARLREGKTRLLLESLFHGRKPVPGSTITIRELDPNDDYHSFRATAEAPESSQVGPDRSYPPSSQLGFAVTSAYRKFPVFFNGSVPETITIPFEGLKAPELLPDPPYLHGAGVREDTAADWWDVFSLTESEQRILGLLQIISPITGVSFVGDPRVGAGRIAKVKVDGIAEPVALASLGDGVVKVFQIAVALEYAAVRVRRATDAGGTPANLHPLLLVDEVESGVHYTLHADLWRFILGAARLLGVQVFATTHSLDCLRGFAEAVAESEDNDGVAIRLEKVEGEEQTGAVIIDREGLPIIVRDSIEVR